MRLTMEKREKIIEAVIFFSKRVKYPTKVKIYKLLFFLDFLHFKKKGIPCLGLTYEAWKFGPVPPYVSREVSSPKIDFSSAIKIVEGARSDGEAMFTFVPRREYRTECFSPREIEIMENLVYIYKDIPPSMLSEISHLKGQPWDTTLKTQGLNSRIDYLLAIDKDAEITAATAADRYLEYAEMASNYPEL